MKIRSVLDGTVHDVPTVSAWTHNLADRGQRCPCRPDARRGIVVHHRNAILEAEGRETIARAVAGISVVTRGVTR